MKIIIKSNELLAVLQVASKIIAQKNALPILDNILVEQLQNGKIRFTASDQETTFSTLIPCESPVEGIACITVPAKLILDTVKELPQQDIQLETKEEKKQLILTWHSGNACIPYMGTEVFPVLPKKLEGEKSLNIMAKNLTDGLNATAGNTATDELRPVMCGIFFDINREELTMVSTNAAKLVASRSVIACDQENVSFVLPRKSANFLKTALNKYEGTVRIIFNDRNIRFYFGNTEIDARQVEGKFPNYKSIIPDPTKSDNHLTVEKTELLNSIRRVSVCSKKDKPSIIMDLSTGKAVITAEDCDISTRANDVILCDYNGEELRIGLVSSLMGDILNSIPYEKVKITAFNSSRPVLVENAEETDTTIENDTKAIICPMRIS